MAALGVFFSASIVILFLVDLRFRFDDAIAEAKLDTENYAQILAEHTALAFEGVDRALSEVRLVRQNALSGTNASADAANLALRQLAQASPLIVDVGWTDASGKLQAHSYDGEPPRPGIADMAHFIAQRDNDNAGLFIAPPYHAVDKWLTAASRRLENPDGSFAGVVTAAIDQSYFNRIYRSVNLGDSGSAMLMHRGGKILAREPVVDGLLGKSLADTRLLTERLPKSDSGSFETVSVVDGVARIAGYKAVSGLPLVVLVTYQRAEILEPWFRHLYIFGSLVGLAVVARLIGTRVLVRRTIDLTTKTAMLQQSSRELEQTNMRFDAALSNMQQGLCLFDAQKNLVVSNSRYREMYDLPEELVRSGTSLTRILQHHIDRGMVSDRTIDKHVETMPTSQRDTLTLLDGRVLSIRRRAIGDGGWVATHEDITEQKRADQLLAEKAAELEQVNARFDAAINNMSQGVCMFDAEQRVLVSNRRYSEIYHLDPGQVRPGTTLRAILDQRREKGTFFGPAPDIYTSVYVHKDNEIHELPDGRVVSISRQAMPDGGWLTTHEDITERAQNEKKIAFLAQHDLLTGLANRALFTEKLEEASRRHRRHGGNFTVLMLDLDRFKAVNDTLGHPAGDQLLVEVAQRLKSSLRDTDVLARLGGDEFAIIQEGDPNQHDGAAALALRIISVINRPFDLNGHQASIGTSVGIAFAPDHGADPGELLKRADLALYGAKTAGRNGFRVFQDEMVGASETRRTMEAELRQAISRNEFELHYQPVVDARTRLTCGVEALVRWRHPTKGLIAPDQFIPLAESTGLIALLGVWVLKQACRDAVAWPAHIKIAVNISAVQFDKGNLFDVVLGTLFETGLSPMRLELEITEAALLDNQAAHLSMIRQLRNLGISIVLDDFGRGYSSINHLVDFPLDKIKIDKSFAQGAPNQRECAAVVSSVLALAHGLNVATTAEGVETEEQYQYLRGAGVDFVQGYLFAQALPLSEFGGAQATLQTATGA